MALESVSASETVIQSSNDDNDLEDGEIPSDEDDEPVPVVEAAKPALEPPKPPPGKTESPKQKSFNNKFGKNRKSGSSDRLSRQKGATSDDWAGDVEKAIRAALEEDRGKNHENKSRNKSNKNKNRKRNHEDKDDERSRDQKKKKLSDEENANEDDDEMLFVRGASPIRKGSHENSSPRRGDHDNYNSGSDYDDRPVSNRHRDDNKRGGGRWSQAKQQQDRNKKISIAAGRRGTKNERGGKNKNRAQLRNDRNSRRNQNNDHNQDPDAICVYYMQGKCHRGDDCPFSHNALPPRKMELCKFYLMDCCAKRDKCLYMHHDFPCKFFHTGLKCNASENCKFSHQPMSEQVKNILLKHLETAPKEILGNFPRLSREGAMYLINNTEKNLAQGQDVTNQKIPSLFELKVPTPSDSIPNESGKDDGDDQTSSRERNSSSHRKSLSGKKTRWGSDEDRVPFDMVVQSASQLGLQLSNSQESARVGTGISMNFYGEGGPNDSAKKDNEVKEEPIRAKDNAVSSIEPTTKDVDLRQLLTGATNAKAPQVVSLAEEAASLTKSKLDDESDHDEEADLVIEMPTDDEDKDKLTSKVQETQDIPNNLVDAPKNSPTIAAQEIPTNLPKKTQELYMRIQQQQREAQDSYKNLENSEDQEISQEDWYSDDDDNDDDDDDYQLTIVLKDIQKDEEEEEEENKELKDDLIPQPSSIPQPAAIVDKLGDLSKIDISMEVSKLLSSIKAQSSSNSLKQDKESSSKARKEVNAQADGIKSNTSDISSQFSESSNNSPRLSPSRVSGTAISGQSSNTSRDPRMSRDPRQRRDDQRQSGNNTGSTSLPASKSTDAKESRSLRLETSIYSSGIIAQDAAMDTDLRAKLDQDHRRKDMDLRCFPPGPSFGDTDLRLVGGHYPVDASKSGDVDLRQILSLPFKPVPSHVPCTEIDASITSHPPISYKVYVVDVPRPDYTGLKLTRNDPQVKYDPRLRKIFRLGKDDLADSPMSPPPIKMLDTPKSPPLVRTDPRRKALEGSIHPAPKIIPTTMQQHPVQEHPNIPGMSMNLGPPYMQGPNNMPVQVMQGMGPPPMMMPGNPMMGGMGPMIREGPGMGNNGGPMAPPPNMRMSGMGPPGPNNHQQQQQHSGPPQNQLNQYDPRYNAQRNSGVGLLGAGPQQMGGYNQDVRSQYDGPPGRFPSDGFTNYGNAPNPDRGFNPVNQVDESNFIGSSSEWNGNQGRTNRKDRRRTTRGKFGGLPRKKDTSS